MSKISGLLDPEARATLDAVFAKWAAAGTCNPDDEVPCVDGSPPSEAHIQNDQRSPAQRNHDALNAGYEKWHSSDGKPETVPVWTRLSETVAVLHVSVNSGCLVTDKPDTQFGDCAFHTAGRNSRDLCSQQRRAGRLGHPKVAGGHLA